jgi:tRNA(Ile)-lysidine synthase
VVLLHLLLRLRDVAGYELSAIHVNHQISLNSLRWADFCGELCAGWGIPLVQCRVNPAGQRGTGPEAAARAARYGEFARVDADWIALAHHRDDQTETVLLNLLRGSGVRGMGAMLEVRSFVTGGPQLLRPLLDVPRSEIENYGRHQGLSWVDDESNQDTRLRRNFVRHRVLPLIEERFPGCRDALARGARWAAESDLLLDQLAASDSAACINREGGLDLEAFRALRPERGRNLLRYWLRLAGLRMPVSGRLAAIEAQLNIAGTGQRIRIDVGGGIIRCYRGMALVESKRGPPSHGQVQWQGEASLAWGDGRIVLRLSLGEGISRKALAEGSVLLRVRQGGERMRLGEGRPRRTLKNLCQEAGIPPWRRAAMPLLWCGEDLVWVPGVGIAWPYQCAAGEPGVAPSWEHRHAA